MAAIRLRLEFRHGADAMPDDNGDGFAVVTNEDGSVQLAVFWTDENGVRCTFHACEDRPKFVLELARSLNGAAESSRLGKTAEIFARFRGASSSTVQH